MTTRYVEIPRPQPGNPTGSRSLPVGSIRIAIFDVGGAVYAIEDACVRCAGPLSAGVVDDLRVTCPACGWSYDLPTGASTFLDAIRLHTFPVVVEPTRVLVEWTTENGGS